MMNIKIFRLVVAALAFVAIPDLTSASDAPEVTIYLAQAATTGDPGKVLGQILQFGFLIGGLLAFGAIVYGAFKYTTSAGNPSGQTDAKDQIWSAVIGLALLLGGFLILRTISPEILSGRIGGLTVLDGAMPPIGPGPPGIGLSDAEARTLLMGAGITLGSGVRLDNMNKAVIDALIDAKNACGCDMRITSATDGTSHNAGTCSHYNGFKADVALNSNLNNYITTQYKFIGARGNDGAAQYQASNGSVWALESNHWDMKAGC